MDLKVPKEIEERLGLAVLLALQDWMHLQVSTLSTVLALVEVEPLEALQVETVVELLAVELLAVELLAVELLAVELAVVELQVVELVAVELAVVEL